MSSLVKIWNGYSKLLMKYPVRTQAISTGVIMGSGDIIAQMLVEKRERWDATRTVKFGSLGLIAVGPVLNFWYGFLDRLYRGRSATRTLKMVATDQLLMAPALCGFIIGLVGFTRNWSVEEARQGLATSYFSAVKTNYLVWPATQFINFTFVPIHFRLFVVNFVALFWNCFLSYISQQGRKTDSK